MDEKKCQGSCTNCSEQELCIPFFDHQNTMMHYNWVNRRSMIQLIAVCIMAIVIVFIFTTNQTKREQMWQDTIKQIMNQTTAAEVEDGQQDKNP
jgi:hypothetical protein